jgi:DNA-binding NtrC family response regulator
MPRLAQSLSGTILVIAPQKELCDRLERSLSKHGHEVICCNDILAAVRYSKDHTFDLILVDEGLGEASRLDLVRALKALGCTEEIVVSTPLALVKSPSIVESHPPDSFPLKSFEFDAVAKTVERALARRNQRGPQNHSPVPAEEPHQNGNGQLPCAVKSGLSPKMSLIGHSVVMKQLFKTVERIGPIDSNVLITGATGTGKELVARAIHDHSPRRSASFVDVNCSAVPDGLFETEFFGHQRGTFTGAYDTRSGLFERASRGTLFLDEVDSLTLAAQAKLLRVLQERQLRRVGGRENISVDARIIAATNSNLKAATTNGTFRADLYFRLRVIPLHVPQLRERGDDIGLLVEYFLRRHAERSGKPSPRFSVEAMHVLASYRWPGNVRELENVIEYAVAMGGSEKLGIDDLPPDMFDEDLDDPDVKQYLPSDASLAEVERRYILSTYDRCGRHHIRTATALGIDRRTLYRKLQQYNIELEIRRA